MGGGWRAGAFAACLLAESAGTARSQPALPASGVELVRVDVVVLDGKGLPVRDLQKQDFSVFDEGREQPISSFERVVVGETEASAPARGAVSTNTGASRSGRTFAVVFDDVHMSAVHAHRGKAAVGEFLRLAVSDGDRVLLVAPGGGTWWSAVMPQGREDLVAALGQLEGRHAQDSSREWMSEYEALRIDEYQDVDVALAVQRRFDASGREAQVRNTPMREDVGRSSLVGIIDLDVRARAQELRRLATERNRLTLGALTRVFEALAEAPGRKSALLVSPGFVSDPILKETGQAVAASLRANAALYFADTQGLVALPEALSAQWGQPTDGQDTVALLADLRREGDGAEALALDTGGFSIRSANDLGAGMARIGAESRVYYLLGFTPNDGRDDGRFRRLEVKLRGETRGRRVRARRGYSMAPGSGSAIARALDSPMGLEGIGLQAQTLVFDEAMRDQLSVTLATQIDVRQLSFRQEGERQVGRAAFVVDVRHRRGGEAARIDEQLDFDLLPETKAVLERSGHTVRRELTLAPGAYQARIVVQDLVGGAIGSVLHDFDVPEGDGLRVSTPILTDAVVREEGRMVPVLRATRTFPAQGTLYCQFAVYGAKRETVDARPLVSAGYEVRRAADGGLVRRSEPSRIAPTSTGALLRLVGINLSAAGAGEYELSLLVRDEVSGESVVTREAFRLEAAGAASPNE